MNYVVHTNGLDGMSYFYTINSSTNPSEELVSRLLKESGELLFGEKIVDISEVTCNLKQENKEHFEIEDHGLLSMYNGFVNMEYQGVNLDDSDIDSFEEYMKKQ